MKQLFVGLTLVSAVLMYAVLDGIGVAIVFAILTFFACFTIHRLLKNWSKLRTAGRTYGVTIAIAATVLLTGFMFLTATDASLSRNRTARLLQRSLAGESEFGDVHISYHETKIEYIDVTGTLNKSSDFAILKNRVLNKNWHGMHAIRWNLTISETGETIDELDYDSLNPPTIANSAG